ncbi:MAG: DNA translocase FtsK [Alphaproteobacteria bacterium MarineAlpha5_Bin11]|nr:cell division protein FtsK [Pelagibacteraceae bacterium]PPR44251.1 MAG: DNA translocase FtsK [Alphaproteobacteria bacterium MarineAlpha5_Bin11]PPR51859.1 MAG: DNA translocase FtsK [Alphaproteobacteria bacterium MarineAlpha5_Bin10]|tara:strand:- start:12381 stop:14648 length:2268 start_codon:yes stop_codon:yes gene_type:complete
MIEKQIKNGAQSMLKWLIVRFVGITSCFAGLTLFAVFFTYTPTDSYYGFSTSQISQNIGGYVGGYIAGTFLNYIDIPSYLISLSFIVWGIKISIGRKIGYKIIRLLSLLTVVIFLSTIFKEFSLYENILGSLLSELFLKNIYINYHYIIINIIKISIAIALIPVVLFSLGLKNNYAIFIFKSIFFIIKNFFIKAVNLKNTKLASGKDEEMEKTKKEPTINTDSHQVQKIRTEPGITRRRKSLIEDPNQGNLNFSEKYNYELPSMGLLKLPNKKDYDAKESHKDLQTKARRLEEVLAEFGVNGEITDVRPGPIVTMYELQPSAGTKSSRIINLADDIARSMSALSVRISSQPGRNIIGIELPNKKRSPVFLSEILAHENYADNENSLILSLGKDIAGIPFIADLEKMPHLLIAGTTGSGKSVGINSMIISLLYRLKPSECRFILIDPKMLELSVYEDIPHLLTPVVTDPYKAIVSLKWAVKEMENRYRLMNHAGVRNILSYNEKIESLLEKGVKMFREVTTGVDPDTRLPIIEKQELPNETLPHIVIIIDEMADLMMVAGKDVEQAIQRLAQMARAAGIHLIMATQRPSVDVITGTIKANFPSRISYHVASKFDSRTILNEMGAEQLLGSGDMLFMENGGKITRLHGGFVSEKEIENVVRFIKKQSRPDYSKNITAEESLSSGNFDFAMETEMVDELYNKAVQIVLHEKKASTSFIQRHLKIGYNRAASIIEQMEKEGLISEANHVGKREVLKNSA